MPSDQYAPEGSNHQDVGSVGRLRETIADHPIAAFVLLTFGWSWGWDLLVYALAGPSPPIFVPPSTMPRTWGLLFATSVVLAARGESVREFLQDVVTLPSRWWLLVVALVLPIAMGEVDTLLAILTGGSVSGSAYPWWAYLANFLLVFLFAGSLEEFGWRAFLQPRLQARYPAVGVALGVGALWATWHLPLFFLFDLAPYDPSNLPTYYLVAMLDSVVLAWLFNETGGSVLAPMAYHAADNLPGVMLVSGSLPGVLGLVDEYGYLLIGVLGVVIVAVRGLGLADERLPDSGHRLERSPSG